MEMTLEQLKIYTPAIRLINGFEMAGYRIALTESLSEDTVSTEESKILAHEYRIFQRRKIGVILMIFQLV